MKKAAAIIIIVLLVIYGVIRTFLGSNGLIRQFAINDENLRLQMEIDSLKSEVILKNKEIIGLQENLFIIEKKARTQMGMTKKGELVFKFSTSDSQNKNLIKRKND